MPKINCKVKRFGTLIFQVKLSPHALRPHALKGESARAQVALTANALGLAIHFAFCIFHFEFAMLSAPCSLLFIALRLTPHGLLL